MKAAEQHRAKLLNRFGLTTVMSRRRWAEIRRRKGVSGIHGVQKVMDRRFTPPRIYWKATWSPEPYVVVRRQFSARKFGSGKARQLAIRARRAGVARLK
jgi:hypothetical protein